MSSELSLKRGKGRGLLVVRVTELPTLRPEVGMAIGAGQSNSTRPNSYCATLIVHTGRSAFDSYIIRVDLFRIWDGFDSSRNESRDDSSRGNTPTPLIKIFF